MATPVSVQSHLYPKPRDCVLFSTVSNNIPLQVVPHDLSESDRLQIVACVKDFDREREELRGFRHTLSDGLEVFVKLGNNNLPEAITQDFFYRCSISDDSAPQIPKVLDVFHSRGTGNNLIVMEWLDAKPLDLCAGMTRDEAVEHAARAVGWLHDQFVHVPDPYKRVGRILSPKALVIHKIFKDNYSPGPFTDIEHLANYFSKVWGFCTQPAS